VDAFLLPPTPIRSLDEYLATDSGGLGIRYVTERSPQETIAEILRSGLRGRGGGGFPTGFKWRGVADQPGTHRYVVANGAEGEPGTFKDRALMRSNPYQLVEGVIVAGFAVSATEAFICLKASFQRELEAVTGAVEEMQQAGLCADCTITVVSGPDEYLYGEEKALLEVIEGNAPMPRLLPPYEHGLFATAPQLGWESTPGEPGHRHQHESNPTLVNNVETLSNVPHLLARGAGWFRSMGTTASPGSLVVTVVGDVARPGVAEVEMGTELATVIRAVAGGPPAGREVKAVFSGVANPVLTAAQLDVALTYEDMKAAGSGLGAAGFIVYDDTACMVEVARQFSQFLFVESCGQCPPCKLGAEQITERLARIENGAGTDADVTEIGGWLDRVADGNRCYLPVEEQQVVGSILAAFPEEFAAHVEQGHCPRPRPLPFPKIADLVDGVVRYDESQTHKRPDWTYAPA
jgi:NADH:ubiquinone oxidoreductase subunit F (NADH-binding)